MKPQWVTVSPEDVNIFRQAVNISVQGMKDSLGAQVRILQNLKSVIERAKIESAEMERRLEALNDAGD